MENNSKSYAVLGVCIALGLAFLGSVLAYSVIKFKEYERTVTVKGLAEQEHEANIVIWPIRFIEVSNDLSRLYTAVDEKSQRIRQYLEENGIMPEDITYSAPYILDKSVHQYSSNDRAEFRFSANQTITVYSTRISTVRGIMERLSELGKQGIVFSADEYQDKPEYLFNRLSEIKPVMIEEATTKAREVALKFAQDSGSKLGKIKRASQGQFSITDRDKNNPHIKKIRVVSTIEYYLSD